MLCRENMAALDQKMNVFKVKFGENGLTKTALTAKCGIFIWSGLLFWVEEEIDKNL